MLGIHFVEKLSRGPPPKYIGKGSMGKKMLRNIDFVDAIMAIVEFSFKWKERAYI